MSDNILDKILSNTYSVELVDAEIEVECRDIPYVLLANVLARLVQDMREEVIESRTALVSAMSSAAEETEGERDWNKVISVATPALGRMIMSVPEVTTDILSKTLVGAKAEHIDALSINDAIKIIGCGFERMNVEVLSEGLGQVFTKATEAWKMAMPEEEETAEPVETEEDEEE